MRNGPSGVAGGCADRSRRQQLVCRSEYGEQECTDSNSTGGAPGASTVPYAWRKPSGLRCTPVSSNGRRENMPASAP